MRGQPPFVWLALIGLGFALVAMLGEVLPKIAGCS